MATAANFVTVDEFLKMERASEVKHEYYDGEVRELPGGTRRHARMIRNMINRLSEAVDAAGVFEVLPSDMRVKTPSGLYTYPDLSVSSKSAELQGDDDLSVAPIALLEVLSPSTEAYDRGEKFRRYERIEALRAYLLVSQDRPQLELFERDSPTARWQLSRIEGRDASCGVESIGITIEMAEVYRGVD